MSLPVNEGMHCTGDIACPTNTHIMRLTDAHNALAIDMAKHMKENQVEFTELAAANRWLLRWILGAQAAIIVMILAAILAFFFSKSGTGGTHESRADAATVGTAYRQAAD